MTITVEFTNHELGDLQKLPEALQLVIDYHDNQSAMAESMDCLDISKTSDARIKVLETARDAMLLERGEPAGTINLMLVDNRPYSRAVVSVLTEKRRIVDVEGWTPAHDDACHTDGTLVKAAIALAQSAYQKNLGLTDDELLVFWPWQPSDFKRKGKRRDLVRACALLLCDLERLDRADDREAAKS